MVSVTSVFDALKKSVQWVDSKLFVNPEVVEQETSEENGEHTYAIKVPEELNEWFLQKAAEHGISPVELLLKFIKLGMIGASLDENKEEFLALHKGNKIRPLSFFDDEPSTT